MRIIIPGGSGHLGTLLARDFHQRGDEVIVLSRSPQPQPWKVEPWNRAAFDGADVVINLAGRSVDCRYNDAHKREIMESRVESTREVGEAIAEAKRPPRVWLQASTATIYAHCYDKPNDECRGIIGGSEPDVPAEWHFSTDVATAWERTFDEMLTPGTRKVKMRSAIVMSRHRGGAFDILRRLARFGLGGHIGDGRQMVSWIHEKDFVRSVRWLIQHDEIDGIVNLASPYPVPNRDFMRALREACGMRFGIPGPKPLFELAAFLHRTETELLLKSRYVVPARLCREGFPFQFPEWRYAARDLCHDGGKEW
ncbi:MAG TPA: TIGR01777 family oxidoreductase [Thermoanaerobaculia bacterium]|nr:TIGR01777 family oxidoreductase [Thermoanaerobaculia bacterium]